MPRSVYDDRRSLIKLIIGLILMSHAANLLIFTAGGERARPPLIPAGAQPDRAICLIHCLRRPF